jgi:uncharacterized membrane protein YdbT with pleckstrin-like domain
VTKKMPTARRHPIVLAPAILGALAAGALAGMLRELVPDDLSSSRWFWAAGLVGVFLLWLPLGWRSLVDWSTTRYSIEDDKIVMSSGLFRRRRIEAPTERVVRCELQRGFLGSMLGYGTVVVELAGGSRWTIRRVARPKRLLRLLMAAARPYHGSEPPTSELGGAGP